MADIPLAQAVLCWTSPILGAPPTFHVGRLGDPKNDTREHTATAGAVYAAWQQATTEAQKLMLFGEVMSILARDQMPFKMVHEGLLVIPEYRKDILSADAPGAEHDEL